MLIVQNKVELSFESPLFPNRKTLAKTKNLTQQIHYARQRDVLCHELPK